MGWHLNNSAGRRTLKPKSIGQSRKQGLRALPDHLKAKDTAREALAALKANGTLTQRQADENLDLLTEIIWRSNERQESFWASVFASVNARGSHPERQAQAAKYKANLFKWLDMNRENLKGNLDDVARDAITNRVVPRGFDWIRRRITDWNKSNDKKS